MEITVDTQDEITMVTLAGRLDSATSIEVTDQVMPQVQSTGSVLVDMSRVKYMSSAGLRMLLKLHRAVHNDGGKVVLVGLAETLQEVMDITGFLDFFTISKTYDEGMRVLQTS
ncbi:MAG: STAS domain-containing protein [Aggregatilineales bacterium]